MIHHWFPQIKSDSFQNRTQRVSEGQLSVIGLIEFLNVLNLRDYVRDEHQSSVIHHWNHELNPDSYAHINLGLNKVQLSLIVLLDFLLLKSLTDESSEIHHWYHQLKPDSVQHSNHTVN